MSTFDTKGTTTAEPKKAAHDSGTPANLLAFMLKDWKQPNKKLPPPVKALPYFRQRRETLSSHFPGDVLLIPTGHLKVRANDTFYPFRPSSDCFYLTGCAQPDCVLALLPEGSGHQAVLFVYPNPGKTDASFFTDRFRGELWEGPYPGVPECRALFGIDDTRPLQELDAFLTSPVIRNAKTVRVLRGYSERLEKLVDDGRSSATAPRETLDRELATVLSEMRLRKDDWEIKQLQTVVDATKRGFEDVIARLRTAKTEREVEGVFALRARMEGNDVGYGTIAAAGAHACVLHWKFNNGAIRKQDLLLLDAGIEGHSFYTADVTRTLPIGGKFSKPQREIYELVWRAQAAAFRETKPGRAEPRGNGSARTRARSARNFAHDRGRSPARRESVLQTLFAAQRQPHARLGRPRLRASAPGSVPLRHARTGNGPDGRAGTVFPTGRLDRSAEIPRHRRPHRRRRRHHENGSPESFERDSERSFRGRSVDESRLGESEEIEVSDRSPLRAETAEPFFGSDNQSGVHPALLDAIVVASEGFSGAYGDDPWTEAGTQAVHAAFGGGSPFFVFNGTGGNVLALQSMLRSYEAVVCADMAHIADDECGAPEKVGGFKLLTAATDRSGKLTVESVARFAAYRGSIHQPQPRVLSITQPTELGAVYSRDELAKLVAFARAQDWFVHIDGARLANAAVALGTDFRAFVANAGIDAVTLGGTKSGFAFGEAVVLFRPEHAEAARFYRKQCLQLASKMRFVAVQFSRYLEGNLWRQIATHSIAMAERLEAGLGSIGFPPAIPRDANALFVKFPKALGDELAERFHFYRWPHGDGLYRLMTSFATTETHVTRFVDAVRAAAALPR